jgi:hypothetical protein
VRPGSRLIKIGTSPNGELGSKGEISEAVSFDVHPLIYLVSYDVKPCGKRHDHQLTIGLNGLLPAQLTQAVKVSNNLFPRSRPFSSYEMPRGCCDNLIRATAAASQWGLGFSQLTESSIKLTR